MLQVGSALGPTETELWAPTARARRRHLLHTIRPATSSPSGGTERGRRRLRLLLSTSLYTHALLHQIHRCRLLSSPAQRRCHLLRPP